MDSLAVYNKTYKLIQSIYSSRLKIQILLSVAGGTKTLAELREVTGSTSQAIIPKIRGLERLALIEPLEHGYVLTPTGKIVAAKIGDFILTMGELTQHKEFWAGHDIDGIPHPFLGEIGELYDSEVKFDTTSNMFHVYSSFVKVLREGSYIHGISSVMSPEVADVLMERVVAGIPVELVVNRTIVTGLSQEPFASKIETLHPYKHFRIWVTDEPLRVGITVTDKHLSFGLNKKEPSVYDSSADMTSSNPKAIAWAERLFRYYRDRSTQLPFESPPPAPGT
jgi:predicted transcriptional regulator